MAVAIKRRLFMLLMAAAIVIPSAVAVRPNFDEPDCVRATAWLKAHRGSLPTSYDELSALPVLYRGRAFGQQSPEIKAKIKREALLAVFGSGHLSDQQHAILSRAIAAVTPKLYLTLHREATEEEQIIEREMIAAFPADQLRLFQTWGSQTPRRSLMSVWLNLNETLRGTLEVFARGTLYAKGDSPKKCLCYCSTSSTWDSATCHANTFWYGCEAPSGQFSNCFLDGDNPDAYFCGFSGSMYCDGSCHECNTPPI